MKIVSGRLIGALTPPASPCVVAVGNFDGVHRGHAAVVGAARRRAKAQGLSAAALTFEPHPRAFFAPDAPPFRLTPLALKARRLASLELDVLYAADFDAEIAALAPEAFCAGVLSGALNARHVIVGEDFRFGRGRAGSPETLAAEGAALGFTVETIAPAGAAEHGSAPWSSSAAREALRGGDPEAAGRILGAWHHIEGVVELGDQRGRALGFPTANLALDGVLLPRFGVYATRVVVRDGPHAGAYDAVSSLGVRPQFDKSVPNFETHLFDFEGDLYGATISVALIAFLRPEARFESVEALVDQMGDDCAEARRRLASAPATPPL